MSWIASVDPVPVVTVLPAESATQIVAVVVDTPFAGSGAAALAGGLFDSVSLAAPVERKPVNVTLVEAVWPEAVPEVTVATTVQVLAVLLHAWIARAPFEKVVAYGLTPGPATAAESVNPTAAVHAAVVVEKVTPLVLPKTRLPAASSIVAVRAIGPGTFCGELLLVNTT